MILAHHVISLLHLQKLNLWHINGVCSPQTSYPPRTFEYSPIIRGICVWIFIVVPALFDNGAGQKVQLGPQAACLCEKPNSWSGIHQPRFRRNWTMWVDVSHSNYSAFHINMLLEVPVAPSGSWGSWGAWLSTGVICWSHWVAPLASEWGHCRDSPFRGVSITNYSKSCLHNTYIPL